jgi:DNA-binding MarR family transcriptional regulator
MSKQVDHVNQSTGDPADAVVEAIHAVMHLFRARQYRVLKDGPHELSHMEAKALGFFARHPGATPSELVQRSGRDKGQVARLIGGLRERGLLEARTDEQDRRSLRLHVSAAGKAVQATLRRQARAAAAEAVQGLSGAELAQLQALLARVQQNLERLG